MTLTADDPRHGKASTYTNHGCRCDLCREASRTYPPHLAATVRYRRKLGQQPRKIGITYEHGTRYGYIRGGCRCPGCTEAMRLYQAAYRARRKEIVVEAVPDATSYRRRDAQELHAPVMLARSDGLAVYVTDRRLG